MKKIFLGLSIIEVLVVITVMGLLVSVIVFTVSEVRNSSRDTARLAHVSQIQTALRAYYRDQGVYPSALTPGSSLAAGNTVYMEEVPSYPLPADGSCADDYQYEYNQLLSGQSYELYFCLGEPLMPIKAGQSKAVPEGIFNLE